MSEDFFWEIIKQSGKNCDNINILRNKMKKIDSSKVKELDSIFNKYYTLIWIKLEPLLKDFYDENSSGFNDFVFYLLSEGKDKLTAFLNKSGLNSCNLRFAYNLGAPWFPAAAVSTNKLSLAPPF